MGSSCRARTTWLGRAGAALLAGCVGACAAAPAHETAAPPTTAIASTSAASSASPRSEAPPIAETAASAASATSAPPLAPRPEIPGVDEPRPRRDCDDGRPARRVCVPPASTEGEPVHAGGCRTSPRASLCRACRPHFVGVVDGQCCYEGLSRLPRCRE